MQEPDFWDDADNSQRIMKEVKGLKDVLETMQGLLQAHEDILLLIEMAYEENDASVIEELETEIAAFEEKFEETRIRTLLSGEYDKEIGRASCRERVCLYV